MVNLPRARARSTAFLKAYGARATIERKQGGSWKIVATDVPVMIEANQVQGAAIDPKSATPDQWDALRLRWPFDTDLERGDRVTVTAPNGSPLEMLVISAIAHTSLDAMLSSTGVVEGTAVESYPVTIERWSETIGGYVVVFSAEAQVMAGKATGQREGGGAEGIPHTGTITFTPVPAPTVGIGDIVTGIPWAPSALVTRVDPVIGNRLEVSISFTRGGA
jgi:hypothetical protein